MKTLFLAFLFFASVAIAAENAETISAPFPADRYDAMKRNSPFALASPVVAAVETPSFARNFFVAGIAKIGEKEIVTIMNQDKQPFTLLTGETADEISLISVEYSPEIGKSKVTIKKGAEFATLTFNEQVLRTPAPVTITTPGTPQIPSVPQAAGPRVSSQRAEVPAPGGGSETTPRRRLIRRPSQ